MSKWVEDSKSENGHKGIPAFLKSLVFKVPCVSDILL